MFPLPSCRGTQAARCERNIKLVESCFIKLEKKKKIYSLKSWMYHSMVATEDVLLNLAVSQLKAPMIHFYRAQESIPERSHKNERKCRKNELGRNFAEDLKDIHLEMIRECFPSGRRWKGQINCSRARVAGDNHRKQQLPKGTGRPQQTTQCFRADQWWYQTHLQCLTNENAIYLEQLHYI